MEKLEWKEKQSNYILNSAEIEDGQHGRLSICRSGQVILSAPIYSSI